MKHSVCGLQSRSAQAHAPVAGSTAAAALGSQELSQASTEMQDSPSSKRHSLSPHVMQEACRVHTCRNGFFASGTLHGYAPSGRSLIYARMAFPRKLINANAYKSKETSPQHDPGCSTTMLEGQMFISARLTFELDTFFLLVNLFLPVGSDSSAEEKIPTLSFRSSALSITSKIARKQFVFALRTDISSRVPSRSPFSSARSIKAGVALNLVNSDSSAHVGRADLTTPSSARLSAKNATTLVISTPQLLSHYLLPTFNKDSQNNVGLTVALDFSSIA
mmetsp:Transcript_16113/g.23418  ORF Transcript_16113/g.23418 Transcript_16113/m.23418 type:complete len:277 (+) Transcript_16113:626-1456(+)|eukprot:CAMPEP_0184750688 /NCGR_PEP_ID=MMETSP0315-20130426/38163_1 /TAXON_ID=101924 /ORGANISM="Rhodosorus marinus, Strain UTEX LB 2760" /LENGTH=276 /DNA_ID=CAMNT_0027229173 /DNA_START=608 /DNA_END=1438 /DNA_ORIENTATION=-